MKKILLLLALTACPAPVRPIADAAINCLGENRPAIDAILGEFTPLLHGGSIRWADVYQRGKQAGREIGTCFVLELTQNYLSGTRSPADANEAYETARKFREEVGGGATVITKCVRESGAKVDCKL